MISSKEAKTKGMHTSALNMGHRKLENKNIGRKKDVNQSRGKDINPTPQTSDGSEMRKVKEGKSMEAVSGHSKNTANQPSTSVHEREESENRKEIIDLSDKMLGSSVNFSAEEWIKQQKKDVVLARVMTLMEKEDTLTPGEIKEETIPVKGIMKYKENLCYDENGILCKTTEGTDYGFEIDLIYQRLVPAVWQLHIFKRVHTKECVHFGLDRVYPMIASRFYWFNMVNDLADWIRACRSCQQAKTGIGKTKMPLKTDFVRHPMERLGVDLQGPFPESLHGNKYIMLVQDYFSKWVELFALPNKTTEEVAKRLSDEIFTRYGPCLRLHSDQGREFESAVVSELCQFWGVRKTRSSPFAPWSCGQVERSNKNVKMMLRQLCEDRKDSWDIHLPLIRMALNQTPHSSTGYEPALLFMTKCAAGTLPCDLIYGKSTKKVGEEVCLPEYVHRQKLKCQYVSELARRHLKLKTLQRNAIRDRKGLKIRKHKSGDYVWRFWKPYATDKLSSRPWVGPCEVLDVDPDERTLRLRIPNLDGKGFRVKWIHVANTKPIQLTKKGELV